MTERQTPKQLKAHIADLELRLRVANEYIRSFRRDVFAGRIGIPDYLRKRAGIFDGYAPDTELKRD
jgi:hypothetical protein